MSFFNVNATFYSFMKFKGESRQFSVRFRRRGRDHNKTFRSRSGPHNRSQLITAVSMLCLLCLFKLYKITGYLISHCSLIIHRSFYRLSIRSRCNDEQTMCHTPHTSIQFRFAKSFARNRVFSSMLVRVRT